MFFCKGFIDRLHINFDIFAYFYLFIFLCSFFHAAQIGYTFDCHYPMNLNSSGHCICVHQGKISAAAGFEPGTSGL